MPPLRSHTVALTAEQADKLRAILERQGFKFEPRPYTLCFGQKPGLTVAVYEKGPKAVIQGKETADFIQFTLEPEVLGEARLGYEDLHHPERFTPHFGIDESGKGDFFGPLVIAGAYTDDAIARHLLEAGIRDSKSIGSDAQIRKMADAIRATPGVVSEVIVVSPEKYNPLYEKIGNLNRLLAWGHARVIENLCERKPDCPSALSDQFANPVVLQRALMAKGRKIELRQQTKAESDYAVAAASILAREKFVDWLADAEKKWGLKFPKGASAAVLEAARTLVHQHGPDALRATAKLHFKTAQQALA
ncbi:MAG: ribonuclease HIII [Verrucomicrobia bacterium]|nr:ribonuclease HIII [Verrucomicrobiota bacterium]